jgi:uncharacterized membrane protein YvlD (DUF360 family)
MKSLAIRTGLALGLNALALLITAALLGGVDIQGIGFLWAVLLFTVAALIARPIVHSLVKEYASWLTLGVALITTFIALLIAELLTDDFEIDGLFTWIWATLIVWIVSLVLELLTPDRGERAA